MKKSVPSLGQGDRARVRRRGGDADELLGPIEELAELRAGGAEYERARAVGTGRSAFHHVGNLIELVDAIEVRLRSGPRLRLRLQPRGRPALIPDAELERIAGLRRHAPLLLDGGGSIG